jgi:hypothetical protein
VRFSTASYIASSAGVIVLWFGKSVKEYGRGLFEDNFREFFEGFTCRELSIGPFGTVTANHHLW